MDNRRKKGKSLRGRPKTTWRKTVEKQRNKAGGRAGMQGRMTE